MTKKNNNKTVHDVILERAQSIDLENMEDWTHFHSGMTREEIEQKFMAMVQTARNNVKGK